MAKRYLLIITKCRWVNIDIVNYFLCDFLALKIIINYINITCWRKTHAHLIKNQQLSDIQPRSRVLYEGKYAY